MVSILPDNADAIQVAIAFPVDKTYAYSAPPHLRPLAEIGKRALVPFGGRSMTGYIIGPGRCDSKSPLKDILDIPDAEPLFPPAMVPFFQWISAYYMFPLGEVITTALPSGLNMFEYAVLKLSPAGAQILAADALSPAERQILSELKQGSVRFQTLMRNRQDKLSLNMLRNMEKAGWIERQKEFQPQTVNYKTERFFKFQQAELPPDRFMAKRLSVLDYIRRQGEVSLAAIRREFPEYARYLKYLTDHGHLVASRKTVLRDVFGDPIEADAPPELTGPQAAVVTEIESSIGKGFAPFLLSGVTGSGKTEVYLRLADIALKKGLEVIVLVPEIALISQIARRFRARFGERAAVLHSGLSNAERFEQWMEIAKGRLPIVIGARSAIFAPIANPGLIIVDEEHDSSYKQDVRLPYHARDIAVVRAKLSDCAVILGSATPSVQSYYNTQIGKYRAVILETRIQERPLPVIEIVDLRKTRELKGLRRLISARLESAMRAALEKGEQILIFLNRRGFATFPVCAACGEPLTCNQCDNTLTFHLAAKVYKCHLCDYRLPSSAVCPICGSSAIKRLGFGAEKIEDAIRTIFPQARVARMDRDTTTRKGAIITLLKAVQERRIDILVGTQMIAKGHDYPHITLVGIICADLTLNFPDFHSGERAFQILAQVAGRAGRGDIPGKVVLQTFNPDHFCIVSAKEQNFIKFYQQEIKIRQTLGFPPFSRLVQLRLSGQDKDKTRTAAEALGKLADHIRQSEARFTNAIQILGPIESPMFKVKNRYRMQIQLKSQSSALLHDFLNRLKLQPGGLFSTSEPKLTIDVDPCSL